MFDPDFIKKQIIEDGRPHFRILNTDMQTVYVNAAPDSTTQTAVEKYNEFLRSADSGVFIIELYKQIKKNPQGGVAFSRDSLHYNFVITPAVKEKAKPFDPTTQPQGNPQQQPGYFPVNGFSPLGDPFSHPIMGRFLDGKEEIQRMHIDLVTSQLKNLHEMEKRTLQDQYEKRIAELESKKGLSGILGTMGSELAPALLGHINSMIKGNAAPINGMEVADTTDQKKRLVAAINKLQQIDPDLITNLEALAKMAHESPQVYKLAIQRLKELA